MRFKFEISARRNGRADWRDLWFYQIREIGGILWWSLIDNFDDECEPICVTHHGLKFLNLGYLDNTWLRAVQAEILTGVDRAVAMDRLMELVHASYNPFKGMTNAQA